MRPAPNPVEAIVLAASGVFARVACLLLLAAIGFLLSFSPLHAEDVVAIEAQVSVEGDETRLTLKLNRPVEARALHTGSPERAVIDLPRVNFQLPADQALAGGVIAYLRFGLFSRERSRLVIDLAEPALVTATDVSSREVDGAHFLTIRLSPVDRARFAQAVADDSERLAEDATINGGIEERIRALDEERPVIVIDPGHGGVDPGAVAAGGVTEKEIVLAFSLRLRDRLQENGRYQVIMTRDSDVFVSLADRVRIARRAQADLFISIHADSISSAPQVRGLTVYTGSEQASDAESARLAERENRADAAAGMDDGFVEGDIGDILEQLTRRETRGFSFGFARYLAEEMETVARLNRNPVRQAAFRVLRAPDVPSVLVELGYLSSRQDIALLRSEEWRDSATKAMAEAIGQYFTMRFANRGLAPVSP